MQLPTLADIDAARAVVYRSLPPTHYHWGLLSERLGTNCWLKHENTTPVGAFEMRGGLTYLDALALAQAGALPRVVVTATGGNHGPSVGWAARARRGLQRCADGWRMSAKGVAPCVVEMRP